MVGQGGQPRPIAEHEIGCKVASPKKLFAWKTSGDFGFLIFPPLPQSLVSTFYLLLSIVAELPSVHHNNSPQIGSHLQLLRNCKNLQYEITATMSADCKVLKLQRPIQGF